MTTRASGTDGLTERTGLPRRAISRALTDLARAGYEMREALGCGKDGRVVFTAPGRGMRFRVPLMAPRDTPGRSPDMATDIPERSPDTCDRAPPTLRAATPTP